MGREPTPATRQVRSHQGRSLPAQPNFEHLKNEAKQRLKTLRKRDPHAKLATAQLVLAREYGFPSWRQLRAHVDEISPTRKDRKRVFDAARAGDVEAVRRALLAGFDPGMTDDDGRTIHQIGKAGGHAAIELVAAEYQARDTRPREEQSTVDAILDAAEAGRLEDLRRLLDAHPGLINARGGNHQKQTALHKAAWRCGATSSHDRTACVRLLLERGADVRIRDYGDNAYALHFAVESADFEIVRMLIEAGSDVIGEGDDHQLGVLGWATCFRGVRGDVADYLLGRGAKLNLWSAIALGRSDDLRDFIARDPLLLNARMSRSEHHRTALHHAAATNRPSVVRLLIELGADVNATDATGATPLTSAAQADADPSIIAMFQEAGATLDFVTALNLKRYDLAEAMLDDDPSRLGPQGRDTIALHLAASKKNADLVRWLIAHGTDLNAKRLMWGCNLTALHITAENGAVDISKMLLDGGANPDIHDDKYDSTVLGWAEYCGQPQVAELLRERGASK
jgi:ankyrin repeat protein